MYSQTDSSTHYGNSEEKSKSGSRSATMPVIPQRPLLCHSAAPVVIPKRSLCLVILSAAKNPPHLSLVAPQTLGVRFQSLAGLDFLRLVFSRFW
jgi:hypothetical protein